MNDKFHIHKRGLLSTEIWYPVSKPDDFLKEDISLFKNANISVKRPKVLKEYQKFVIKSVKIPKKLEKLFEETWLEYVKFHKQYNFYFKAFTEYVNS